MSEHVFQEVTTPEQGQSLSMEKYRMAEEMRDVCETLHRKNAPKSEQQKAYQRFLIKYGEAFGTMTALLHCRRLNAEVYMELRQKLLTLMAGRLVELIS